MQSPARHSGAASSSAREDGFTIVEVMAAIVVFTVGVLGTMSLFEQGVASTRETTQREQGVNLARDLVERSHQASYVKLASAQSAATLREALPTADNATALTGGAFDVTRRGTTYSVTVTSCSIDDPADGGGVGGLVETVQFCIDDTPTGSESEEKPPLKPAVGVQTVLGIPLPITASGNVLDTVCNVAALDSRIGSRILNVAKPIASVSACPGAAGGRASFDINPDDLRYVSVQVAWTHRGRRSELNQSALIPNPDQTS